MKKNVVSLIGILVVISLAACSNKLKAPEGDTQNVQTKQEPTKVEQETETMTDDLPKQGEISQSETTVIENSNQDNCFHVAFCVIFQSGSNL